MFSYSSFEYKTTTPLPLPNGVLEKKSGYIVEWKGHKAELAPIKQLSGEDLDECLAELRTYESSFVDISESFDLEKPFFGQGFKYPKNNSVLFCLESLLLSHYFEDRKVEVPVNLMGTLESLIERPVDQFKNSVLKFKFGKSDPEQEKNFLLGLPNSTKIRLDANQKMSKVIPDYIRHLNLDYLEEPYKELDDYKNLQLPFALDENRSFWKQISNSNLVALVSKPSLELSLSGTYKMAKESESKSIRTIVSSAYETPTGLKALLLLAALINDSDMKTHHGLDGLSWYESEENSLKMKFNKLSNF